MPARTKFKLSAVALGEINDACESLERRWQHFEGLNSPPDFKDLIADFDSKALDDDAHIKYELTRELIEADIQFRQGNGVAVSKAAYSDMLALQDEAVLNHFVWDELASDNESNDLSFVVQQNAVEAPLETQTITPDTSNFSGAVSAIRPADQHSRQIGHYKLLQQIGEGGMGTVWMAEQEKPVRRRVALKLIKSELASKEIIARFEAERQALAMMDHPNIARVLDAGTTETGNPYFVMELIKGTPLNEYCDKHELSIKDRLQIMVDVCEAVQHAHQKGILHRDLKPSNVLVSEVNGKPVPKVIDFGLAKAMEHTTKLTDKTMFTQFGQVVGTLQYMSPEQAGMDSLDIDTRTDIYSLGVMLYEMLAGSTPLDKDTLGKNALLKVLELIREMNPPRPSTRLSSVANTSAEISRRRKIAPSRLQQILKGELDWIVMKAIEKDRNRRYGSAASFADDIQRFLNNETVEARPPSASYRISKLVQKNRGLVAALGTIAALLVVAVGVSSWFAIAANSARNREATQRSIAENKTKEFAEERDRANVKEQVALKEAKRADKEAKKATVESKRARDSEAAGKYQLANARWDANRVFEARDLLEQIQEEYRNFEWNYSRRHFLGSDLTCYGHTKPVRSVTFSPDGARIASASDDKIKLWDAASGHELITFNGDAQHLRSVAFSPDGTRIASASGRGIIKLWDVTSGQELTTLRRRFSAVSSVTFSPDGNQIALGLNSTIKLWDVASGQERTTVNTHRVTSVTFSPDGTKFASGSRDGSVKLWDLNSLKELTTLKGYSSAVTSVTFSPDGTRIAAGSTDSTIKLWDMASGQELVTLYGHTDRVTGVNFSPNGTRIASGSGDGSVKLWDVDSGQELTTLKGHLGTVTGVTFSPDGTRIASGSNDRTFKLWDAASGQEQITLNGHTDYVIGVSFNTDGTRVASASNDNTIKLWDVTNGQELVTFNTGFVTGVAFSPDGTRIASGSSGGSVKLWDVGSGQELTSLKGHLGTVTSVTFSPDGTRIASGSRDNTIKLWDAQSGQELTTLSGHTGDKTDEGVSSVSFSPDGTRIASGSSSDRTIKLWDADSGQELTTLRGHFGAVSSVTFSPDGTQIASGSNQDSSIKLWDTDSGQELTTLTHPRVTSVTFSPDGTRIATGSGDNTIKLWDVASGQELTTLYGHTDRVTGVTFSPDGTWIASGSWDNMVKLWNASSGKELTTLSGHTALVTDVILSPDGTWIASDGWDGMIKVWDLTSGQELNTLSGNNPLFSPDGTQIVSTSSSNDDTFKLWDVASGRELISFSGHAARVNSVSFSPDGARIVSGSSDRTIKLWNAANGQELTSLSGHTDRVTGVTFSPDGTRIASGSWDSKVKLWNAASGQELITLSGHTGSVNSVAFSADGTRTYSNSDLENIVWDSKTGKAIENAKWVDLESEKNVTPDGRWWVIGQAKDVLLVDLEYKNTPREKAYRQSKARFKPFWHQGQAKKAEQAKNWYAATFHRAWLMKSGPKQAESHDLLRRAYDELAKQFKKQNKDVTTFLGPTAKEMLKLRKKPLRNKINQPHQLEAKDRGTREVQETPTPAASKSKHVSDFVNAISRSDMIGLDREGPYLFDFKHSLKRYDWIGTRPRAISFSEDGRKVFLFYATEIVEIDRLTEKKRSIKLPSKVSGRGYVALPNSRFAIIDNRKDVIHIINDAGKLLKVVAMGLAPDERLQNVAGIVVDGNLIVSEDGQSNLLAIDLDSFEISVFKKLSNLKPWLGEISYSQGHFYVCTADEVYRFVDQKDDPELIAKVEKGNITGIVVSDETAYIATNFGGEIIKLDLKTGNGRQVGSGLIRPDGLERIPPIDLKPSTTTQE